jgi:hypothetical protein
MTIKRDNGKGDLQRPLGVPMETFDKNFEAIFGKKEKKVEDKPVEEKKDEQD